MGKANAAVQDGLHFSKKKKCYVQGTRSLKGVLASLTKHYFRKVPLAKKPKTLKAAPHVGPGKPYKVTGVARGKLVGQQLITLCRGAKLKRTHPYTQAIMDELARRKWKPWKGEAPVGDGRLATGVDLLAKDESGALHAIEIKSGRHTNFETNYGNMRGTLAHVPNSAYSQACVQLAVTDTLLRRCTPTAAIGDPVLFHVSDAALTVYPLPGWAAKLVPRIYNEL